MEQRIFGVNAVAAYLLSVPAANVPLVHLRRGSLPGGERPAAPDHGASRRTAAW